MLLVEAGCGLVEERNALLTYDALVCGAAFAGRGGGEVVNPETAVAMYLGCRYHVVLCLLGRRHFGTAPLQRSERHARA